MIVENSETGKFEWVSGIDPVTIWDKVKNELVDRVMSFAGSIGDNPNSVGKDPNIWAFAYLTVKNAIDKEA